MAINISNQDFYTNLDGKLKVSSDDANIEELIAKCEELKAEGKEVGLIRLYITNIPDKYNLPYEKLNELGIPVVVHYGQNIYEALEINDFLKFKEYMNQLKSSIIKENMTPFEKVLAVYRYIISKPYKFHEGMGSAHNFIFNEENEAICEDYCSIMRELLSNEPGICLSTLSISIGEELDSHAELLLGIDDETYGLHGMFVLDPTHDTFVEKQSAFFGEDHTPGEKFERFMMALTDPRVYFYADAPFRISYGYDFMTLVNLQKRDAETINKVMEGNQAENLEEILVEALNDPDGDYNEIYEEVKPILKLLTEEQVRAYFRTPSASNDTILIALEQVLIKQGFEKKDIDDIISRARNNMELIAEVKNR